MTQLHFWREDDQNSEHPEFLTNQLITYIGNKRALLNGIGRALSEVKRRLGRPRLRAFDVFSGSGVVSRFLKAHAEYLVSNDIEDYAAVAAQCYLSNHSEVDSVAVGDVVHELNSRVETDTFPQGFIEELYAPRDETCITREDRVFYTKTNARRLDDYRRLINIVPFNMRHFLLGPLLSKASIHANTSGVFKGFHKNRETKIGQFGGTRSDALSRIRGTIKIEYPVFSKTECDYEVLRDDANSAARRVRNLDFAYS